MNCYPFIEAERAQQHSVKRACELMKVSRSAYYAARRDEPSPREREDAELAAQVRAVHEQAKGRYWAPWVHAQLRADGRRHSRKRVARLMRAAGIRGRAAKRWEKTTVPDPAAAARADRIRRDFTADASKINTRWCGDITYIATWEGWLYLATVIDIASRRVVGALTDHLRTELISDALSNAVTARDPAQGVIFHSDRGCSLCIDDLEGVGGFIEAERMVPEDADAQAIQAELAALIESLDAAATCTIETYDSLVHAARRADQ